MSEREQPSRITEEDVEGRTLERRAFLRRFGVAAGLAGLVGFTAGCDPSAESSDADASDAPSGDVDATDAPAPSADSDASDAPAPSGDADASEAPSTDSDASAAPSTDSDASDSDSGNP